MAFGMTYIQGKNSIPEIAIMTSLKNGVYAQTSIP
jgi:hypothetical protein